MASADCLLSEDEFTCSVCMDFFIEPVSIPCGHNFCKACITRHWEGKNQCLCPLCNEKFSKGLKLRINTGFREVVQKFQKQCVKANNDVPVKPGQVPCDCCTGKKFKASKTCLECLVSYCETHLEPHHRVDTLKRHKLTDPVQNLDKNVCKNHNRILDHFCRKDLTTVCDLCTEHSVHDRVPLKEQYEETKAQLEQKMVEVQEMVYERQKKVQQITEEVDTKRKHKDEAKADSVHVFSTLGLSIQRSLTGLVSVLEEKQIAAERQAEVLVKELEREINQLQRRITKLEDISHTEDHFQLIKRFLSSPSSLPRTKNWSDISVSGQHRVEDVKRAMVNLEETLIKEMERARQEFRVCCKILLEETDIVKKRVHTVTDLDSLPEGVKLVTIQQQHEVDMTLDPSTANDMLLFSEDLKQVQTSHIWWISNVGPQKFNRYAYVLGKKGFSNGKFYYEVVATQKTGWDLGVVRESLRGQKTITPNPRNGAWILRLRNNTKCQAMKNVPVILPLMKKPERVGVFVDYEQRLVSFYDVDTASLICSFTDCRFGEKIYPFFSPGFPEDGINGGPLILSPAKTSGSTWENNSGLLAMIITVIALVLISLFQTHAPPPG
ncbi:putative E3 ubiquitin-protein ligase TRIM39-like [Scophthalmus maximus]|uniref:Putative E3 ubiquitin-protein ligase TRIM39-like n=1 Tax=Scophthalmus maximus TaxID=52904 RepID=A0A2U9AZ76_SCOMX|nr:E3 ubiquitin-protein ligase TRIM39 isoform X1 [Scophthalmus maximus]AWO96885.1 putative E3 ubiquitin-protein ligase TRIM39-like [Scophthalmus maximus]KAF0045220.1 hypothetical protein F2P81_001749 [Scophthalmus maximus]